MDMKIDLHFYGIAVLARAGGFNEEEALTIAYASQYVDDSTESEPLQVGKMIFEPVRTAHYGLEAFDWSVQKKIYIPFHFLPARPIRKPGDTFLTAPGSKFTHMVWDHACSETDTASRPISMGIALHTFADSWSHKWFSGRLNSENDVENIHVFEDNHWKHLKLENIYLDTMPQIGHAEAGSYPDLPQIRWKYRRKGQQNTSERKNSEDFLKACKEIHRLLTDVEKDDSTELIPWGNLAEPIYYLLKSPEYDQEKRWKMWREEFADLFIDNEFDYDKLAWRKEALEPKRKKDIEWDDFSQTEFGRLKFPYKEGFYESNWVRFHRGALKQRHFVLENLL